MTPDEFDQKRRELIATRTKYAGNEAVTNRITNLIGLLGEMQNPINENHRYGLEIRIMRGLKELAGLTSQ